MLGTIAWHSGPFTGAVESGPKCDADSTVASWLIAVEEAFKGMGEVTSDHSLRVSEHLGGEQCLHDAFAFANAIQTNGSLQSLSHVTGSGGDSRDNEITEQCNSDGRKGKSSVPRCSIVKKPPFFHNLKQSMEVEWWEDALGTPV